MDDETWWRSTALHREMAYVGGTLYASGGLLVLLTVVLPSPELYARAWVTGVGAVAMAVGAFFLWAADRWPMPLWQYAIATSVGAVLVTVAVLGGGAETSATYGVLYVFVSTYGFYYYPWPIAWWLVGLNGAGFALALGWHDVDDALPQWLMIVGASVIAGGLIGTLGQQMRRMLATEQAVVADLSEIDSWKTTFLRAVSHDLRAPLSTIHGMLTLVQDRGSHLSDEQRDDLVSRSIAAAERSQRLVDDLLDLERIQAGEIEPRLETTPLDRLVRECLETLDLHGRELDVDLRDVTVDVEPGKVERIVTNLVGNAVRHTPAGTHVRVCVHEDAGAAVLVVEDDGPGLPEDVRDSLFDAYRGSGAGHAGSGSVGLGLHLVRRFTELQGGSVSATDRPGGGARFEVRFPRDRGRSDAGRQ